MADGLLYVVKLPVVDGLNEAITSTLTCAWYGSYLQFETLTFHVCTQLLLLTWLHQQIPAARNY